MCTVYTVGYLNSVVYSPTDQAPSSGCWMVHQMGNKMKFLLQIVIHFLDIYIFSMK